MKKESSDKIITLASYPTAAEAEVAASLLRSMGIEVEVINAVAAVMLPFYGDNQVRLLVNESDYARAVELLQAGQTIEK